MSVYMESCNGVFKIKKKNISAALKVAKELARSGKYAVHWDYGWKKNLFKAKDFIEFLTTAGWQEINVEKNGDITNIYAGEYYNDEDFTLFKAIAPLVEAKSYLDIETSEGEKFEWYFDGYTCIRKEGTVDYDSNIEIVKALLTHKKQLPTLLGIHPELDKRIHEVLKEKK